MLKKIRKKTIIISIITIIAISSVSLTYAYFDASQAVTIDPDEIEVSTLAIGTHLIHISAMSDELYEIAVASASESGQSTIYYKSELADGLWFDIDSVTNLSGITENGSPVDESIIEEILFTHHTKSDGKTYDLQTGEVVSLVDIVDPYDVENLSELETLSNAYDILVSAEELEGMDEENADAVKSFFTTDVRTDETDSIDAKIAAVNEYMSTVNDDVAQVDILQDVMIKLDASRRAIVFEQLETSLEVLALVVETNSSDDLDGAESIISAIAESQQNVFDSLRLNTNSSLTEGEDAISQEQYETINELIDAVLSGDEETCQSTLTQLIALDNLANGTSTSPTAELEQLLLLIEEQKELIEETIEGGETDEYQEESLADNVSTATLQAIENEFQTLLKGQLNTLEYYLQQACDRMTTEEKQELLKSNIEELVEWDTLIKEDDFEDTITKEKDDYQDALNTMYTAALQENSNSELDELLALKETLQTELMSKLDEEKLEDAAAIELEIAEVDSKIQALNNEILAEIEALQKEKESLEERITDSNSDTINGQIAEIDLQIVELQAQIAQGSVADTINSLKESALEKIGDTESADSVMNDIYGIEALIPSGGSTAATALQEIYEAAAQAVFLDDQDQYEDLLDLIEEVVSDNASMLGSLSSSEEIQSAITSILGIDLFDEKSADDSLSEYEEALILAIIGVSEYLYVDATNEDMKTILTELTNRAINEDNPDIFDVMYSGANTLVPVDVIADNTGYRYIWNSSYRQAILAKRQTYYTFQAFSEVVELDDGNSDEMDAEAQFQNSTLFIDNVYAEETFDFLMKTVYGTQYGVVYDEQDLETINSLLEELGGGI